MSDTNAYTFSLTPQQIVKFEAWAKQFDSIPAGCCGGAFTFSFVPTSIGTVLRVKHFQGQEINLTEYDEW